MTAKPRLPFRATNPAKSNICTQAVSGYSNVRIKSPLDHFWYLKNEVMRHGDDLAIGVRPANPRASVVLFCVNSWIVALVMRKYDPQNNTLETRRIEGLTAFRFLVVLSAPLDQ